MACPSKPTPFLSYINSQAIKELEKGCKLMAMLREHLGMVLQDGTASQFVHIFEEISHTLALSREILISTSNQNFLGTKAATLQGSIELGPKSKKRKTDHEKSKDCQRRKYNSKRTELTPMPDHDGYQWRKYGQKNILDKKYPRCYYRCTYHHDLNCNAAKQVQQCNHDDVDQPLFEVTYFDEHTCNIATPKSKSTTTTNHNVIDFSGKSIPDQCCLSADNSSMFAFGTRNNEDDAALVSCLTHVIKGSYSASSTETSDNSNAATDINPLNTSNEYSSSVSTNHDDGTMEFMIPFPEDHETMDPEWWPGHDNTQFFSELWNSMHHF